VTCIDINYASNLIACGTSENHIILWDMRSKNLIYQLLSHSEPLTGVAFSQDSTVIISSSYDGFW
jgi:WD40 repeat protein